jgi:hypothetical protein
MRLIESWSLAALENIGVDERLINELQMWDPKAFPTVEKITSENIARLRRESSLFRKTVRGEAIGELG